MGKYLLDDSPRRHREDKHKDPIPSLARCIPTDGRILQGEVSLRNRRDGSIQFCGKLSETILNILGVSERPLGRPFSIDTKELKSIFARLDEEIFAIVENQSGTMFHDSLQFRFFVQVKIILTNRPPSEENFEKIRVLGRGGFGRVYACRNVMTGKLYALKVINKKRAKYKNAESMCLIERETLEKISSPFNMSLKYAFSNDINLYLVLDLMIGGDLSFHLHSTGTFTMDQARYYAARIVCALGVLHRNHYIYRDLKPENILLDNEGKSKLSDFGLTCKVGEKGYVSGVCGTRGYWAPEMHVNRIEQHSPVLQQHATPISGATIQQNGSIQHANMIDINISHSMMSGKKQLSMRPVYSYSVDWFSLGCCIYEFLVGVSPFRTDRAKTWAVTSPTAANLSASRKQSAKDTKDKSLDAALQEMEPDLDAIDGCRLLMLHQHHQQQYYQELNNGGKHDDTYYPRGNASSKSSGSNGSSANNESKRFSNSESKEECKSLDEDLENVKDLLRKLLQKDPIHRLGSSGSRYGRNPLGYQEIQAHPWFATIDWSTLYASTPPFVPSSHQSNAILGSEIGDFEDEKMINRAIKEIDHSIYRAWDYVSVEDAEEEVVELLIYQDRKKVGLVFAVTYSRFDPYFFYRI